MYRVTCPHGCVTPKTQQPRSFITEETYNKHMKEFHSKKEQIVQHPIRDLNKEIDELSKKVNQLEIENETYKNKLMEQSQLPPNIDLRTIEIVKKKKTVKNKKDNEINEKMIEVKDDKEKNDNNKKLT